MPDLSATAIAHPNIAFIKYWGNRDASLRLPQTGSLSMNLAGLQTTTTVHFGTTLTRDRFILDGCDQNGEGLARVSGFLDRVRALADRQLYAEVCSRNNFPQGSGIASSASGFAALALAGSHALGLSLKEAQLSRLARLGSGSACRSIPDGFVEWLPGTGDADSYAVSIAPASHWDLVDLIAVVDPTPKRIGSTSGHDLAQSSPLNALRVADTPGRLARCREAVLARDFAGLAEVVEQDSNWMHAVMRTSKPPIYYWTPATEVILWNVVTWRGQGHAVCATVDAGPNVHVISLASEQSWALQALYSLPGVQDVLMAKPGEGARLVEGVHPNTA